MNINSRIPKEFYKLFHSKYMEYYQVSLISLYEESAQSYSLLGLTEEECQEIMNERIASFTVDWSVEQYEEDTLITRSNMASIFLGNLKAWGWLRSDYDEVLNSYVISFPDYSQLFVDLFQQLYSENESRERESLLVVYTHLFTYYSGKEKDNQILKSALHTSKALLQMLSNMQEGIRGYFEELSKQNTFIGIQEVLVSEINNSDSRKYAILTTKDSFYRYKEEVKELIEENLKDNEVRKQQFEKKALELQKDTIAWHRNERMITCCEEAAELLYQINREFDVIERRYNKLIEQKRTFAKRAVARSRYIMVEGDSEEDNGKILVKLLNDSKKKDEILDVFSKKLGFTVNPKVIKERSFSRPRGHEKPEFSPVAVEREKTQNTGLEEFVVKPLYTKKELEEFRKKNEVNGKLIISKESVSSVEDLEKLLFVWQEATENYDKKLELQVEGEYSTEDGFTYSGFSIG